MINTVIPGGEVKDLFTSWGGGGGGRLFEEAIIRIRATIRVNMVLMV